MGYKVKMRKKRGSVMFVQFVWLFVVMLGSGVMKAALEEIPLTEAPYREYSPTDYELRRNSFSNLERFSDEDLDGLAHCFDLSLRTKPNNHSDNAILRNKLRKMIVSNYYCLKPFFDQYEGVRIIFVTASQPWQSDGDHKRVRTAFYDKTALCIQKKDSKRGIWAIRRGDLDYIGKKTLEHLMNYKQDLLCVLSVIAVYGYKGLLMKGAWFRSSGFYVDMKNLDGVAESLIQSHEYAEDESKQWTLPSPLESVDV